MSHSDLPPCLFLYSAVYLFIHDSNCAMVKKTVEHFTSAFVSFALEHEQNEFEQKTTERELVRSSGQSWFTIQITEFVSFQPWWSIQLQLRSRISNWMHWFWFVKVFIYLPFSVSLETVSDSDSDRKHLKCLHSQHTPTDDNPYFCAPKSQFCFINK